jgi:hypothetical protein
MQFNNLEFTTIRIRSTLQREYQIRLTLRLLMSHIYIYIYIYDISSLRGKHIR